MRTTTYPIQGRLTERSYDQDAIPLVKLVELGQAEIETEAGRFDGLTRYDGERFHTFTTADGLAADTTGLIFEDRQGTLWFGTGGPWTVPGKGMMLTVMGKGVSHFDGREFHIFTKANGLANNTVMEILEDKQGNLWVATDAGVAVGIYLHFQNSDN